MNAIAEVESAGTTVAQAPPPAASPAPEPAKPTNYLVFFDWDKSDVTPAGRQVLETFNADLKQGGKRSIVAIGHTDTSGPADYNMGLSARRAKAVRAELEKMDVPADSIAIEAKGETEPLVPTGDGVREPQNRRVELISR